jgi:hypothetical protein
MPVNVPLSEPPPVRKKSFAFAEIGHSLYAEDLLKEYYIGALAG